MGHLGRRSLLVFLPWPHYVVLALEHFQIKSADYLFRPHSPNPEMYNGIHIAYLLSVLRINPLTSSIAETTKEA